MGSSRKRRTRKGINTTIAVVATTTISCALAAACSCPYSCPLSSSVVCAEEGPARGGTRDRTTASPGRGGGAPGSCSGGAATRSRWIPGAGGLDPVATGAARVATTGVCAANTESTTAGWSRRWTKRWWHLNKLPIFCVVGAREGGGERWQRPRQESLLRGRLSSKQRGARRIYGLVERIGGLPILHHKEAKDKRPWS